MDRTMFQYSSNHAIIGGTKERGPECVGSTPEPLTTRLGKQEGSLMGTLSHTHPPRQTITHDGIEYEIDPDTGAVKIPLHSRKRPGLFALVDKGDVPIVAQYRWNPAVARSTFYATAQIRRDGKPTALLMHRLVMGVTDPRIQVDHAQHNGLDNRKSMLRIATNQQNQFNRRSLRNSSSRYKGVSLDIRDGMWEVQYRHNQQDVYVGRYRNEELAARMYDQVVAEHQSEFACLNFPLDPDRLAELLEEEEANKKPVGYGSAYGKSRFRGVGWWEARQKWVVSITYEGRRHYLGLFVDEVEGAKAYDAMAKMLNPRIPRNFPDE